MSAALNAFAALAKRIDRIAADANARMTKLAKREKADAAKASPKARKPKAARSATQSAAKPRAKARKPRAKAVAARSATRSAAKPKAKVVAARSATLHEAPRTAPRTARPRREPKYKWSILDNTAPAPAPAPTPEPAPVAKTKPKLAPVDRGVRVVGRAKRDAKCDVERPPTARSMKLAGMVEKLDDAELVLLTAAMSRADRCLLPIPSRFEDRHQDIVASLRKMGLVVEIPAQREQPKWQHGGEQGGWGTTLIVTDKAFDALGIDRPPE